MGECAPKRSGCYVASCNVGDVRSAIGLDLEWPFTSSRIGGVKEGKVALVQICDADIILLIQVSKMKRM
jgi:hypothetical protein